jgi:rhodanese-related sulfurtransferase
LGAQAEAEYDFAPAHDGDRIDLGAVQLGILETPGHTPEGISILVYDTARDAQQPQAVLTGDTLFIGDVGRPDLMASVGVSAEELAGKLYDSLHDKLLPLPDETIVYPAHGAGSMCGKNLSRETSSTLGQQRLYNYALRPMSRSDFIGLVTADQPATPAYFAYDAMLNRQERPTLGSTLEKALRPLDLETVLQRQRDGAYVVDVRDPNEWAEAHLAGSIDIGLGGQFATWAGTLLERDRPIVLVAEPGRETEAATRLGRIGFDQCSAISKTACKRWKAEPTCCAARSATRRALSPKPATMRQRPWSSTSAMPASVPRSAFRRHCTFRSRSSSHARPSCRAIAPSSCTAPAAIAR